MKKTVPFDFVLSELEDLAPYTKPMFGCTSVYVGEKIVFILRQRGNPLPDDGVWLATTGEHHASLQKDFPSMRSLEIFGPGPTGWQVLPVDAEDFEDSVLRACEMIRQGDPRIGKIPKPRWKKKTAVEKRKGTTKTKKPAKAKPKKALKSKLGKSSKPKKKISGASLN
jgi:hypothetical protein